MLKALIAGGNCSCCDGCVAVELCSAEAYDPFMSSFCDSRASEDDRVPSGVGTRSSNREVAASSLRKRSVMKTIFSSRVICGVVGWVGGVASTDTSCGLILLEESSVLASWASSG